jgi:hypothetical protein
MTKRTISNRTEVRALVGLKGDLLDALDNSPAGNIYRQARSAFQSRAQLIDQVNADRDTLRGGRSGLSVDELREELRHLSQPELVARIVGLRSALHEEMGETLNGASRTAGQLLT